MSNAKPKRKRLTFEQIKLALAKTFRQNGYDGTSLDDLSIATHLGRSSLYHHFPAGKQEIGRAALAQVITLFDQQILQPLSTADAPMTRLQRMVETLDSYYEGGDLTPDFSQASKN